MLEDVLRLTDGADIALVQQEADVVGVASTSAARSFIARRSRAPATRISTPSRTANVSLSSCWSKWVANIFTLSLTQVSGHPRRRAMARAALSTALDEP